MNTQSDTTFNFFTPDEARDFVRENLYVLSNEVFSDSNPLSKNHQPRSSYVHCIDDRHPREVLGIPIPGAILGLDGAFIIGLDQLEEEDGHIPLYTHNLTLNSSEELFGLPSHHTDTKAAKDPNNLSIRGCGHCFGSLSRPEEYLFSEETVRFMTDYIKNLPNRGSLPLVYEGDHQARAFFIIKSPKLSLHHQSAQGLGQAYVYHRYWHLELIKRLSERMSTFLDRLSNGKVDRKKLATKVQKVADQQSTSTVIHLGANKIPTYEITGEDLENFEMKLAA